METMKKLIGTGLEDMKFKLKAQIQDIEKCQ